MYAILFLLPQDDIEIQVNTVEQTSVGPIYTGVVPMDINVNS